MDTTEKMQSFGLQKNTFYKARQKKVPFLGALQLFQKPSTSLK